MLSLSVLTACTSPTGDTPPPDAPTGTLLMTAPNGDERGVYLVDVSSGTVTQIATQGSPLRVTWAGGYQTLDNSVVGNAGASNQFITKLFLTSGAVDTLLELPDSMWLGSYDLSPDGRKLAIQTGGTGGLRLWQVDLVSGSWERWIDAASGLDAVPLTGLKWTPDAKYVYALTEVYPAGTSELIRLSATTDESEILSASTDISIVPWLDIASDGTRLAHGQGDARLVFRDPSGKIIESLPTAGPTIGRPVLSPDGRFVAFMTLGSEARSIEIMRLSDGSRWPLHIQEDFELWPVDWF